MRKRRLMDEMGITMRDVLTALWKFDSSGICGAGEGTQRRRLTYISIRLLRAGHPQVFTTRGISGRIGPTPRSYTALVRSYGLRQECNTPHSPEQNGVVKRLTGTLKGNRASIDIGTTLQ